MSFLEMVSHLESEGLSRADIAKGLGFESTTQLRDTVTIANNAIRREDQLKAQRLRDKGWSATAIGKAFDPPRNESSIRALLNPQTQERAQILENTVSMLRDEVDAGGWIDIGRGQEFYVPGGGISKEKLRAAVSVLKAEDYVQIDVQIDQPGTKKGQKTNYKLLCPPGTTYKDVVTSPELIRGLTRVSDDGGRSVDLPLPPMAIDSKRVAVRYKEDGGAKEDGVIYVRPGVEDVSIGGSAYAQVRINVDGTHYLKGMAVYKNDLPDGVDLLFNTNKSKTDPKIVADGKLGAMKKQEPDPNNPFGASIRRQITTGKGPDRKLTSVMNILDEEGSWDQWSRSLSSQVLSKQSPKLAEAQLGKTYQKKRDELDEILGLTNPTVRAHLLEKFADSADSDAVHLSAAGLPRSSYHVILPFNTLKDTEVYAPNFNHGEKVALIRYPHGGTFEIPVLTVNNNHPPAKKAIGRAQDAVGINHKVAERLSGADFDGDFVMVIPNNSGVIKSTAALKGLEGFDPHKYKLPDDVPKMKPRTKQKQMGDVSNLITDMTIKGASHDEIARAVRHSMVVIDAEKHHLDYKRSAIENGIPALKAKYQDGTKSGASTLISRASSQERVNARRKPRVSQGEGPHIDPATGRLRWVETGEMKTTVRKNKKGEVTSTKTEPVQIISTKMAETHDARTLLSDNGGTVIERVYADHANRMKGLANQSRRELVNNTDAIQISQSAKRVYADDIAQLKTDLRIAQMNSPRERQALVIADTLIRQKVAANPDMDDAQLKKVKSQALAEARTRAGAKKVLVPISERQWEAIQAGAVSKTMLNDILKNTDIEKVKEYATPRPKLLMSSGNKAVARVMLARGATQAEVAAKLGVSLTTLKEGLKDG
jgi:hypothetical protein